MRIAVSLFVLTLLVLCGSPAFAELPSYNIVKEKSSLKFIATQNSAPIEGRFMEYSADILFDPEKLDKSHIKVEVDVGSVQVQNPDVQQNITLPDWLSVQAFPKATFATTEISRTPMTDDYYAKGELTLRGKTVPINLNFQLQQKGKVAIAKGYATLNRLDFGVGQGDWAKDDVIKQEVRVEFRILAEQQ